MSPSRVLVATDLDDPRAEALVQAHDRARAIGALLGICHVLPSAGIHMLFPQRYAREAAEELSLDERARAAVTPGVTATTERSPDEFEVFIEHGTPYAEIVRRAESWHATLAFVGGRGDTEAAHVLSGSAEKVARYAHCPVLVARHPAKRGLVLCATDLSAPSLPAVAAAVAEARLRSAKLVVLHIVDQGVPLATVTSTEGLTPLVLCPEMLHDLRASAHTEIAAVLGRLEAQAEAVVVEGHAASTILKYVEDSRPELVVVGAHGRTALGRILLGSVAEHVVRAAETSVLVVRLPP
jgi:nucleotide-binding universal stress UspA family protein